MRKHVSLTVVFILVSVLVLSLTSTAVAEKWYNPLYSDIGTQKVGPNTTSSHKYSSHFEYWSQGASIYGQGSPQTKMQAYGCRIVAQSKLLAEAGIASKNTSTFNPDVFYNWTVNKGYQQPGVYENAPLGQAVIGYANEKGRECTLTKVSLSGGNNASNDAVIMQYLRNGYYCYLYHDKHCAYVLHDYSLQQGTAVVSDSFSDASIYPGNQWFSQLRGYDGYGTGGYGGYTFTQLYCYKFSSDGTLDVNGLLDGANSGGLGAYGTFDVYINGNQVKNDVSDYCEQHPAGTSYEIRDIKANAGYEYLGESPLRSGTISAGNVTDVRLSFATQGHLLVQGSLDGIEDSSIAGYGTFDVYINGEPDATGCTSYNKQWPKGTSFEVKNIQAAGGKHHNADVSTGLTGTIVSAKESKAIVAFSTDGTATPEWQTAKILPGNLEPDMLDIEYKHTYTQSARTSPGEGWELVEEGAVQYENDGGLQYSDDPQTYNATKVFVGNYYFHWCNNGNTGNYFQRDYLPYKHTISMEDAQSHYEVVYYTMDGDRAAYRLRHLDGQWAGGYACCCAGGCEVYYRGDVYQNKKAYQINIYTTTTDWTATYDPTASSYMVRWRLKDGLVQDYRGLRLNFTVDGESRTTLAGVAGLDIYIDGEKKAENVTSYRGFLPRSFSYDIVINHTEDNKLFKRVEGGTLNGTVTEGNMDLTLVFETGVLPEEDWKEIETGLLPYVDEESCDIEYQHTYIQQARTSPGEGWELVEEGPVQYENDGGLQYSDDPQTYNATKVFVGNYYFHWCNNGNTGNYFQRDYLPYKHTISMEDALNHYEVVYYTMDGDRAAYRLRHLDGQWAGGYACCCAGGCEVYYKGDVYQNKKAYRINTYRMVSEWTTEQDPTAASTAIRIRVKRYNVSLFANGGFPDCETAKTHGIDFRLAEDGGSPTRENYILYGWNSEEDGTGIHYDTDGVISVNAPIVLYAEWRPEAEAVLPGNTTVIEEQAFENTAVMVVKIPYGCTSIRANAFAYCTKLTIIYIPETVESIDPSAFTGIEAFTIVGKDGSYAEFYASKRNWITFEEE